MVGIRGFEPLWLYPLSKLFLGLRDVCPYRLLQSPQSQVPTRQYVAAPIITLPPSIFKVAFASFPKFLVTVTESPESTTARNTITSKLLRKSLYLKEHKPILYNALLLSGKLTEHLVGVDAECRERLEPLLPQIMRQEGVDEALKARDQMEWVRRMNSIQNRAEEILLNELVYA